MFPLSISLHSATPGSSALAQTAGVESPTPIGWDFLPNKIGKHEDAMEISWNIDIGTRTVGI